MSSTYETKQHAADTYQTKSDAVADLAFVNGRISDVATDLSTNYATKNEIPQVPVQSVNGHTGDVVLSASDVSALPCEFDNVYYIPSRQDWFQLSSNISYGFNGGIFSEGDIGTYKINGGSIYAKYLRRDVRNSEGFDTFGQPIEIPTGNASGNVMALTSDLPQTETWTFVLSDDTTITKNVCIY